MRQELEEKDRRIVELQRELDALKALGAGTLGIRKGLQVVSPTRVPQAWVPPGNRPQQPSFPIISSVALAGRKTRDKDILVKRLGKPNR